MTIKVGDQDVSAAYLGGTAVDAAFIGSDDAGLGGAGGGLDWVPDNAKIHIDLVGNRAWTEDLGRVLAARKLGITEVPVMVAAGWTEAQKRAYVIADNKLTLNGGWDVEMLKLEIADITDLGFELPLLGFSPDELLELSATPNAGLTDPDDTPEAPEIPVSELGDVWIMGTHRLACGSSN